MNDFFDTLGFILILLFIFAIVFVFDGTPDLWDVWHDRVMEIAQQK